MAIIRRSIPADATRVADLICRSVRESCVADHHDDADILDSWLGNKTPESAEEWISAIDDFCVTAINASSDIVGFGMLSQQGEITLLYVSPDQAGTGIGRELLSEIERHAVAAGLQGIFLDSTDSAMKFYEYHGYRRNGSCDTRSDGLHCTRMSKQLACPVV